MKKFYEVLNAIEYIAFIVATVFVLVFQFTGAPVFVTVALGIYVFGFGVICLIGILQTVEIFKAAKETNKVVAKNSDGDNQQVNIGYEKTMKIIKTIIAGLFTIFTLIVLILY